MSVKVTYAFIEQGKSARGGWNKRQIQALGLDTWRRGWKTEIINSEISDQNAELFLTLKDNHLAKKSDSDFIHHAELGRKKQEKNERKLNNRIGSMSYKEQLLRPEWQRRRLEIMQRDKFRCMLCGRSDLTLYVHHNTYDSQYIWNCSSSSMITLCKVCHDWHHQKQPAYSTR